MSTKKLTKKMIDEACRLSYADRIELACNMFECSGTERDNTGQILLFTECMWTDGAKIRRMTEKDFE